MTRLWVTGVGLVTALGTTREATWARLLRGERGIAEVDLFDTTAYKARLGGAVRGIGPVGSGEATASRTSEMALIAAREAIAHAGVSPERARTGLVVGGTTGGMFETEVLLAELAAGPHQGGPCREPGWRQMLSHPLTATSDRLEKLLGPFARVRMLSSACSSGANAILVAATWILSGELDVVVAGASDGLCRLTWSGFQALSAMDPEPCRPFDRSRRGLNLGEGAGFVVIERSSFASSRGKKPVCELAGWAAGSEAHHVTNPEPSGKVPARLIERALGRASLTPAQIDYVNAHGTATPLNDAMETTALGHALGAELSRIRVSSSKAQLGHTLAAAGAIEAGIVALCIERQQIVPTAGLTEPDPECNLAHVPGVGIASRVRAAISNSFGFGGMDAVLAFSEPELGPGHAEGRRRVVVTGACVLTPSGLEGALECAQVARRDLEGPAVTLDMAAHLELARARRLDRGARMGAIVANEVLGRRAAGDGGIVIGGAFGNVDASAAFLRRLITKGPRLVSPADFPNLVPSSQVGHASIYLGLEGPALATADLAVSGECAFVQASELVAAGEADRVCAGAVEESSAIVSQVLAELFGDEIEEARVRAEGAVAIALEAEDAAHRRGVKVLARVAQIVTWRESDRDPLSGLSAPPEGAIVVLGREVKQAAALLDCSTWRARPRISCARGAGNHEAVGGIALAVAVSLRARNEAPCTMALGPSNGRGYAVVFA